MLRTPPDFGALIKALAESGADVVIIGGLAMVAYGSDYTTTDIDYAYRRTRENATRIASALAAFHPRPEGWDPSLPYIWDAATIYNTTLLTLLTDKGSVDLLGESPGIESFDALQKHAKEMELYGFIVKVASLQDLILMKEAANRTKDQAHLLELRALLALVEEE